MASPPVIDHVAIVTMIGDSPSWPIRKPLMAPMPNPTSTRAMDQATISVFETVNVLAARAEMSEIVPPTEMSMPLR